MKGIVMYINHSIQKKQYFGLITFLILWIFFGRTQSNAQDTSWTFHPLPFQQGMLYDLNFVDDATGWAVGWDENAGTSVIVNTVDSGAVWILQNHPPQGALFGVHFMTADTGYAVGQANYGLVVVLKTTNGGITWQAQNVPPVRGFLEKVTFAN